MNFAETAKYLKGTREVLALLHANHVTVAQVIAIAKGIEPILSDFDVTVPPDVHVLLGLLDGLALPLAALDPSVTQP